MSHGNARTTVHARRLIVSQHQAGWPQAHIAKVQVAVAQHQLHLDVCRVRSHTDMAPMAMASNVTLPAMSST